MYRSMRWKMFPLLTLAAVAWCGGSSSEVRAAEANERADKWEFTIPIRYISGQTFDFDHGTSIETDSDLGWGFGFGYNLSEKMELTFDFSWMSANYDLKLASATGGSTITASGTMDVSNTGIHFNYNFMPKTVTPYISAGIGWNWVDSNIPNGYPETGCWWDPWYGYICTTYQSTISESGFAYGIGAGIRIEPKPTFYLRFGVDNNWQDFGSYADTPDILSYRMEMGWKF